MRKDTLTFLRKIAKYSLKKNNNSTALNQEKGTTLFPGARGKRLRNIFHGKCYLYSIINRTSLIGYFSKNERTASTSR